MIKQRWAIRQDRDCGPDDPRWMIIAPDGQRRWFWLWEECVGALSTVQLNYLAWGHMKPERPLWRPQLWRFSTRDLYGRIMVAGKP